MQSQERLSRGIYVFQLQQIAPTLIRELMRSGFVEILTGNFLLKYRSIGDLSHSRPS